MTRDEIVAEIIDLLRGHLGSGRGDMGQDPYRSDLFKVFARAHRAGLCVPEGLRADPMAEVVIARWIKGEDDERTEKLKRGLIQDLAVRWTYWQYAWDNYDIAI